MLQRIQSLYLFIATLLTGLMLIIPLGRYIVENTEFSVTLFGLKETTEGYAVHLPYLGVLGIVTTLLLLVTIFLFKNRLLQIRLCFVSMVLLAGMQVMTIYYIYHASTATQMAEGQTISYSVVDLFPLVSVILVWMAMRAIGKDEALIRSMNRIR